MKLINSPLLKTQNFIWRIRWWLLAAGLIVLFSSHFYNDLQTISRYSMEFMKSIFRGTARTFYSDHPSMEAHELYFWEGPCTYHWPFFLLIGIWNIPLILLEYFGVSIYESPLCLMWIKLLSVLFGAFAVGLTGKLAECLDFSEQEQEFSRFHLASSCLMIFPILIMTQVEVISLVFVLIALRAYLLNESRKFVAWSTVALMCKPYYFVVFVSLILLKEKSILRSIFLMLIPFAVKCILDVIIPSGTLHLAVIQALIGAFNASLDISYFHISLMLIGMLILWYWCYFQDHEELTPRKTIWVCFVTYAIFFGPTKPFQYWVILMAPFMTLCVMQPGRNRIVGIILESASVCSLFLMDLLAYPMGFDMATVGAMVPPYLFGKLPQEYMHFSWMSLFDEGHMWAVQFLGAMIASVYIAAMILFSYHTCPFRKPDRPLEQENIKVLLLFRAFVMVGISMIPLAFYILMSFILF